MNCLLDSCSFLWLMMSPERIPAKTLAILAEGTNTVFVSHATAWECQIKVQNGKLRMPGEPVSFIEEAVQSHAMEMLPISLGAIRLLVRLPPLHRDPFDRMIIAQALYQGYTLISPDREIQAYPVPILWD